MGFVEENRFEIIIGTIALLSWLSIWAFNKFFRSEEEKVTVDSGILVIVITLAATMVFGFIESDFASENPLLIAIAIFSFVTGVTGIASWLTTRTFKNRLDFLATRFDAQMKGLGHLTYFPSKEEAFIHLTDQTNAAREKLMATRFSPGDISTEDEYWLAIKRAALDPKVLSIRVHSLAHANTTAIDGVCKLIEEFRGAPNFRLGITFFSNEFEIIVADDKQCIFCFHDLNMTIKNGFRVETSLPGSAGLVDNIGDTFRRILDRSYIVVDFEKFVKTDEDVKKLQTHLRQVHSDYVDGKMPRLVHTSRMESYLADEVLA